MGDLNSALAKDALGAAALAATVGGVATARVAAYAQALAFDIKCLIVGDAVDLQVDND